MATVESLLTYIGYSLNRPITTTSEPTQAECIQWINQTLDWIVMTLAELGSELGRTVGTVTTTKTAITAATQASPCQITAASHGIPDGQVVTIAGISGMTEINNLDFTATYVDANNFTIGVDASDYTAWSSGGYVYTAVYDDIASDFYAPHIMTDSDGQEFSGWIEKSTERVSLRLATEANKLDYAPGQINEPEAFYVDNSNNIIFLQTPDAAYTIKIPYYQTQSVSDTDSTVPFLGVFDNLIIESIVNKYLYRTREDAGIEWNWFSFVKERAERIVKLRKKAAGRIS
jgi:hypothetical protein